MPDEEIERAYGSDAPIEDTDFEVWEENWVSWEVFRALTTQWTVRDSLFGSAYQGINYASVKIVMWAYRVKNRRGVFDDVREMELAARDVLNGRGQ